MPKDVLSLDEARKRYEAKPSSLGRARAFVRTAANAIGIDNPDIATCDRLLDEIRTVRRSFPTDQKLAYLHAMALANAKVEAASEELMARDERLLAELRTVLPLLEGRDEWDASGFDIDIMGAQYLGLLQQRRFNEADAVLADMSRRALGGTQSERLEWLSFVRHGFWIILEQNSLARVEKQIELVRRFRREHPGDDYEAPHALLAMLLGTFEYAERRGDADLADRFLRKRVLWAALQEMTTATSGGCDASC